MEQRNNNRVPGTLVIDLPALGLARMWLIFSTTSWEDLQAGWSDEPASGVLDPIPHAHRVTGGAATGSWYVGIE